MPAPSSPLGAHPSHPIWPFAMALLCTLALGSILLPLHSPRSEILASTRIASSEFAKRQLPNSGIPREARVAAGFGRLPLRFEANTGQTDTRVKFLSRGRGYTMFLTGDEAVLSLRSQDSGVRSQNRNWKLGTGNSAAGRLESGLYRPPSLLPSPDSLMSGATHNQQPTTHSLSFGNLQSSNFNSPAPDTRHLKHDVLRLKLVGANPKAKVTGLDELPGKSNYFIGNDLKKWRTNVSSYARVKYQGVYPGIDVVYYGSEGGQLEYDFVVAPGADPNAIAFDIVGAVREPPSGAHRAQEGPATGAPQAAALQIDANGDLVIPTDAGEVRFHKPVVYQSPVASTQPRRYVDGRFVLLAQNRVGFEVASYDKARPLVIDPYVDYVAYLGGANYDEANGIAVDADGFIYVTGLTGSTDFPIVGPAQGTMGSMYDVFVAKLDPVGSSVVYATYLGGNYHEMGYGIAVDSSRNAFVAGGTMSTNFPTVNALQSTYGGVEANFAANYEGDGFVAKLNPAGDSLLFSTYLGGINHDWIESIALDPSGNAYALGQTASPNFPVTEGAFDTTCGTDGNCNYVIELDLWKGDIFITKLGATGSQILYSTYLGGAGNDMGSSIAVDSAGSAFVTGTASLEFPTSPDAFQTSSSPFSNAFMTKLSPDGSGLAYSSFLHGGSAGTTNGFAVALDSTGTPYFTGETSSTDFPTTPGAFLTTLPGSASAFVTKLDMTTGGLAYSTYLGGEWSGGRSIAVDSDGNAWVTGEAITGFPTTEGAFQPSFAGGSYEVFVTQLNATGSSLLYSTYFGGSGNEWGREIKLGTLNEVFVVGTTQPTNFLVTPANFNRLFGSDGTYHGGEYDAYVMKISPGIAPQIGVSQISVTFLDQPTGTESEPVAVTIGNFTSEPLDVSGIESENGDFRVDRHGCVKILAVGEKCVVEVFFTPTTSSPPALRKFAGGSSPQALRSNPGSPPRLPSPRGTKTGALALTSAISTTSKTDTIPLEGAAISALANLDKTSLDFDPQPIGTTSPAQSVTLTNVTDDLALSISSVSVSAGFGQTSNCASSVPIGGDCTFQITSSPTATGASNGTLSIATNAVDSPHVVTLSGNGTDFVLDVQSGGATSATVAAGGTASFDLQIEPTGFVGNVSLGCAFQGSTPRGASCSVSPNVVALNGTDPGPFTVNVATTARSLAVPRGPELPPAPSLRHLVPVLLGLTLLMLTINSRRVRKSAAADATRTWASLGIALLSVLLWTACGGGGGGSPTPPSQNGTPAGTYTLTITATVSGVTRTTALTLKVN